MTKKLTYIFVTVSFLVVLVLVFVLSFLVFDFFLTVVSAANVVFIVVTGAEWANTLPEQIAAKAITQNTFFIIGCYR